MPSLPATIVVRPALPIDAARITELYRQLLNDTSVAVSPERIAALSLDTHALLLVCEWEQVVSGTAMVSLCPDVMYQSQPFAVIENIVVDKQSQEKGIGTALMHHIEAYCLSKDCSKMMLLSSAHRTSAHAFFERMAFDASAKKGFVKYRRQFGRY
ncbi:GNAT family N-acetyltransferase [Herbaspirillum rubrisubalbicans]|uniref:N-acetyltransferase n=1 Tax=Herbaspirillum rubrisubalbicans TaxID=80842 RepID=A0AAD0XIK3_9BURK|nr:GNAT family N-acetyltransferase [Herbaspirillum rubrisubalbicans]ALU91724.1 GCN5-related N-acetyltransferase [Herbaspirillum rubrisubalbicans M1]AYR26692.1 N-acetyltransferase [Herbaspirillum rubrisubalbicans]